MSTESYILELNHNNAIDAAVSNSEYTIQLATPVVVNPGDQVGLRMASIDSQKVSDDNIIIDEDTNISITFSIYDVDYSVQDKRTQDNAFAWPDPTFDYYAAYNVKDHVQLTYIDLDIIGWVQPSYRPPPSRSNTGGSFLISKENRIGTSEDWFYVNFTYIDASGDIQTGQCTGTNAEYQTPLGWQSEGSTIRTFPLEEYIFKEGSITITGYNGRWPSSSVAPVYGSNPPGAAVPTDGGPISSSQLKLKDIRYQAVTTGGAQLDLQTTGCQIPKGVYDPQSLAVYITQLLNESQGVEARATGQNGLFVPNNKFLQRADQALNANMIFRVLDFTPDSTVGFTNQDSYVYNDGTNPLPVYIGASQFAIEYGSAGQVFSLNFAHMPLWKPENDKSQCIGYYWTGTTGGNNLQYFQVNQSSGIVIHDLQPVEFWRDKLGLYSQLITPLLTDSNGVKFYLKETMKERITYGYASIDAFILSNNGGHDSGTGPNYNNPRRMIPNPPTQFQGLDAVYIDVTGQTRALIGTPVSTNSTGGYYLIEVLGLPPRRGVYIDDDETNCKVSAIVSKQFDSNNIITGYADSGIPYTHVGIPTMISSLRVRILDENKNPVGDLGPNNTIFIEVTKQDPIMLNQQAQQQQKKVSPESGQESVRSSQPDRTAR